MYGSSFDGPNNSPSHEASNEGNKVNDAPRYYPSSAEMEPATPSSRYTAFEQLPASPQSYTPSTTFRDNVEYVHYNLPAGADRSYGSGASDHARPLQDYRGDYQESPASSPSQSYSNRAVSSRYDGEWSPYNSSVYPQNPYIPNSPTSVVPLRGQGQPWPVESRHRSQEGATAHPTLPPLAYPPASTGQMGSHTFPAKPPTPPHDHDTNPTHHPIQPHRSNWNTLPPIQPPYIPSPTTSTTVQLHFNQQQPHHQQRGQSPQDVHSYMGEISPPSIPASLNSPSSMTGSGTWYLTPAVFNWLTAVLDPKRRSDKSKPTPHGQCELCDVVCQRSGTLQQHIICQHRQKIARQVLMSQPYNEVLAIAFTVAQLHSDYQTGALTSECVHFRNLLQSAPHGLSSLSMEQFPLLREKLYELSNTEKWKGATCEYCGLLVQRKATLTDHLATCPSNPNPRPGRRRQDFKHTQSPPTGE